jgi:sortase A
MNEASQTPPRSDRSADSRRRPLVLALVWSERALLVVGLACLAAWASACANRTLYQVTEERQFEAAIEAEIERALMAERHDVGEWSAQRVDAYEATRDRPVEALGRLDIPDAGVSVMVLEGTDDETLDRAVGRIPGTARIGEPGNLGIAGHRDGFFRGLRHLTRGDEITLATLEGVTRYRVSALSIVEPEAVEVLDPTPAPTLTLVTCYPFYYVGSAPRRYIVHAEQVGFEPWTSESAAHFLGNDLARR